MVVKIVIVILEYPLYCTVLQYIKYFLCDAAEKYSP